MSLTIELDEQTAAVVRQLATDEKRTASEIVRDALATYARLGRRPLPTGMGEYRSGRGDTSRDAREIIRRAVEEGKWP
jgi:predicted transcriptional regulator